MMARLKTNLQRFNFFLFWFWRFYWIRYISGKLSGLEQKFLSWKENEIPLNLPLWLSEAAPLPCGYVRLKLLPKGIFGWNFSRRNDVDSFEKYKYWMSRCVKIMSLSAFFLVRTPTERKINICFFYTPQTKNCWLRPWCTIRIPRKRTKAKSFVIEQLAASKEFSDELLMQKIVLVVSNYLDFGNPDLYVLLAFWVFWPVKFFN